MDDLLRVLISVGLMVGVGVFGYAAIAALNVWTRRMDGKNGPRANQLDELYARLATAETLEARVEELEQRVDFAERLIAQQRASDRLPAGPLSDRR